ncbi:PDZ domain-containing protein, partial [Burkholderia sp. Ac-20379]|uniref:PDZ domain-containing protein n=1 Tax=Burkholderia sp. Ac-20379 TaxID=2703900 RepID=UPI00197F0881
SELTIWRGGQARRIGVVVGALDSGNAPPAESPTLMRLGLGLRAVDDAEKARLGVQQGLVVESVNGVAAQAGLKVGDVVLSINGTPVGSPGSLVAAIGAVHGAAALLVQRGAARLYVPFELG